MTQLVTFMPAGVDMRAAYDAGSEDDQQFVQNLALFLTSFLRQRLPLIESQPALHPPLMLAIGMLIKISYVDDSGARLPSRFDLAGALARARQHALGRVAARPRACLHSASKRSQPSPHQGA